MDLSENRALVPAPNRAVLAWSPHPLMPAKDRRLLVDPFLPGETIAAYLERHELGEAFLGLRPVLCTIDGHRVPRALWPKVKPKPGTLIGLQATLHGGGGDDSGGGDPNKTNRTIGIIAVAIAAYYTGSPNGLGYGIAGQLGVFVVGGLAVNKLFPVPKPHERDPQQASPTYSLQGGSNRMRPYEPMPKIIGQTRFFPDLGAKPYTEFSGEDQYLNMVFDFGYNDLVLSEFKIGDTPISEFDSALVQISGPDGKLTLFPGNVDSTPGEALLNPGAPLPILRTTSPDTTAIEVEITGLLFATRTDGQITQNQVTFQIEYRAVGAPAWTLVDYTTPRLFNGGGPVRNAGIYVLPDVAPNGKVLLTDEEFADQINPGQLVIVNASTKPVRKTYYFLVAQGQYEVRVTRLSGDDDGNVRTSAIAWSQMRSYQPDTADYTGRTRAAVRIKASGQLQGVPEQFNCIASARCETWNGIAWVTAETSNPAWWVLDGALGRSANGRRVYGGLLPESRIDRENLKLFASWCTQKGLTFNGVFDQQIPLFDLLNTVALCGRGTVTRATGKLGVVWDAPALPWTAVYSMANIERDSFEVSYATGDLADEIALEFRNPDRGFEWDIVRAPVPGVANPVNSKTVRLLGCESKPMAAEHANLLAAANVFRLRRYRWRCDWEGMQSTRGDVALIGHDLLNQASGRLIEGSSAAVLKLSRKVARDPAGTYIAITKPNGDAVTCAVQPGSGDTDTLPLVAALPFDPGADPDHRPYDYRFIYGVDPSGPGRKVKIDSWVPKAYNKVEITAIDEVPAYYASALNPVLSVAPGGIFGRAEIADLQLSEMGVRAGNGYLVEVTASWTPGIDYARAEVRLRVNSGEIYLLGGTTGRSLSFRVTDGDHVFVEVTAYSLMSKLGRTAKASIEKDIAFASSARPSNVTSLYLNGRNLVWPPAPEADVVGARFRFHLGNRRTWEDAAPLSGSVQDDLHGIVTGSPWALPAIADGQVSIGVVYVDAAGLESPDPLWIVTDMGEADVGNIIQTIDLKALGWPGTQSGAEADGAGGLRAIDTDLLYTGNPLAPMYTGVPANPFYDAGGFSELVYETGFISPAAPLAGSALTIERDLTGDPTFLEYRQIGNGPFYTGNPASAFYTGDPAAPFYTSDPADYQPWPGRIFVGRVPFQFRARAGQGPVRGRLQAMTLVIDAPDLEQELNGFAIAAPDGTRLALGVDFTSIKQVQATLVTDAGGTAVGLFVEDHDAELGPLVTARDKDRNIVAGKGNFLIRGW